MMSIFTLVTIEKIKEQYPILKNIEGFDLFEDWSDDDYFLVTEGDVNIEGGLHLDLYEDSGKKKIAVLADLKFAELNKLRIEGVLIQGNLTTTGCIINEIGDYGPFVFIGGKISCQSLLLGGSYVEVEGNVTAKEVVMTDYNHGRFNCKGTIEAPVFIVNDHYTTFVSRKNELFYYNDKTDDKHPSENECIEDDETDELIISPVLRAVLENPLTETFEELKRDLAEGEFVLKGTSATIKNFAYWKQKIAKNYRDLRRVPNEYKDKDLCMMALNTTFYALPFVKEEFITAELCWRLIEKDGFALKVIPDKFITLELCFLAAEKGTILSFIPEDFYNQDLILDVFKNYKYQPDIQAVPKRFMTEEFLIEYVKMGKGLYLDKCCTENNISKTKVLTGAMDAGIEYLDNMFANHCSKEVFDYASKLYNNNEHQQEWNEYIEKYRSKLSRLGLI
ncbi:hypothetical protein ACI6Q2_02625 [Chitinophagaceae bacterium LWZ2-11]